MDLMLMKKEMLLFCMLSIWVLSLVAVPPVAARTTAWGWSTLPFTDAADDVYEYTTSQKPAEGIQGDYRNDIDIEAVDFSSTGITIMFNATPVADGPHEYTIDIDKDGNGNSEYHVSELLGNFFLQRFSDAYYWNGASWSESMSFLAISISGTNLTISGITTALGSLASVKFAIVVGYTGDTPTIYADYAPGEPADAGIPGFSWIFVCLIIGLITLILRNRSSKLIEQM